MLRKLLEGRLVFTPMADGALVEFRGTGVLDPVLRGIVNGDGLPKASGSRWSHQSIPLTVLPADLKTVSTGSGRRRIHPAVSG